MRASSSEGFTVIEVVLFLAISGLLLLMVFVGTGTMAARQRFSDATDNLQAFLQAEYDEVRNGVNIRQVTAACPGELPGVQPGASAQCLLLGKVIKFDDDTGQVITSSYVVSTQKLRDDVVYTTDSEKFTAATLEVLSTGRVTYEPKWGANVSRVTRSTASLSPAPGRGTVNAIAFLKVPDSGRIVQFYYMTGSPGPTPDSDSLRDALQNDQRAFDPPDTTAGPALGVCLENNEDFLAFATRPHSMVGFASGGGAITTNYNPGSVLCP